MVTSLKGRETQMQTVYRPGGKRHESSASDWVPTTCRMCLVGCGVLVHMQNHKVVNVIGNPDSPINRGRICAKGKSGIMNHYNPNRITKPLKRTNSEKGIGIDPKWQEISWEEAIETISIKMRKIHQEDPRKLYLQTWGGSQEFTTWLGVLRPAFGTPYVQTGVSPSCGKTVHSIQFLVAGGFHPEPALAHCKYLIDCGTQMGVATREGFNHQVPDCAKARERGLKLVVVDPIGNNAAAKADEWLPIRPGTDAAFGMGMLNVLLNEARIFDAEYLKHFTNAAYLVGVKGKFVRDPATGKPLLYDQGDGKVKTYDDPTLNDPLLEGEVEAGQDWILMSGGSTHRGGGHFTAFPGRTPTRPERWDLFELFPVAAHTRTLVPEVYKDPGKWGIDHKIEMVIHSPGNQVMAGWGDVQAVVNWYKSIDLVVGFAVEINETHELDDIVLPMRTYMEEGCFDDSSVYPFPAVAGEAVGFCQIQQGVVEPPEGVRSVGEVMTEIYQRVGILDEVYQALNNVKGLKPAYSLEPGKRYSMEEVSDRIAKSRFGAEYGWNWFKENGVLVWPRSVDERYPGRFIKARIALYLENFIERGEELGAVLKEMGLAWDLSDYEPLPHWRPCESYEKMRRGEIDAVGVNYKLPYAYGAHGNANPWINELCEKLPHSYGALINKRLAQKKGIKDGDPIWLESPVKKVRAVARVTECVHPEVIGIAGNAGHWAKGKPLSMGKGVNFNGLLPYGFEVIDVISSALDQCAPLKVYKA